MHTQTPAPFPTAEAAWFWTAAALEARRHDGRPPPGPCRPEDVVKCLDELYRRRRIELLHARILRLYGRRGRAPNPKRPAERCDWRLWHEAMERLVFPLRQKGLLPPAFMPAPAAPAATLPAPAPWPDARSHG